MDYQATLYDESKITEFGLECTIPLAQYVNIKPSVKGTDPEQVRLAMIEFLTIVLPIIGEQERIAVNSYLKNTLVPKAWEQKEKQENKKQERKQGSD